MGISEIIVSACAVLICMTFHEFAHGWVAYKLGDTLAKEDGRLTLNPFKHIDPIGFLCMIFFRFGWAKPVSCRPDRFKHPTLDFALVAAAGPIANFITAIFFILATQILDTTLQFHPNVFFASMSNFFWEVSIYSVSLGLFNLIPLPPLDGSKIIRPLLPQKLRDMFDNFERYGIVILVIILYTGVFDGVFGWLYTKVISGFYGLCGNFLKLLLRMFI